MESERNSMINTLEVELIIYELKGYRFNYAIVDAPSYLVAFGYVSPKRTHNKSNSYFNHSVKGL